MHNDVREPKGECLTVPKSLSWFSLAAIYLAKGESINTSKLFKGYRQGAEMMIEDPSSLKFWEKAESK